jgi:D-alanyl-D-alanine carboxypeptidase
MFTLPDVPDAQHGAGLTRFDVAGTIFWGKSGDRPGYNNGLAAARNLSRKLAYSVNTLRMGGDIPQAAQRIIAAAVTPPA